MPAERRWDQERNKEGRKGSEWIFSKKITRRQRTISNRRFQAHFKSASAHRTYPWGNEWPPPHGQAGNYHGMEGAGSWGRLNGYNDGFPVTAPVDELWENPWGLKGVGGNVWEACADAYKSVSGWRKTWRSASWSNFREDYLRCRRRFSHRGNISYNNAGFRLVLAPE